MTTTRALARRPSLPDIASATLPESYERAKSALAKCDHVDECKDWADKAAALASYAKQSDDQTLHNFATRIQARAVRRCGELLKTFQNKGAGAGRPSKSTVGANGRLSELTQRLVAEKAGLSEHQELQAVRVANVPAKDFDTAIESDHPATVTRLAELGKTSKPAPPGFVQATHAIGTVKEFAKFCEAHSAEFIAGGIYDYELPKVLAQVEVIAKWLLRFSKKLRETQCSTTTTNN
jgi:hypothetical protein